MSTAKKRTFNQPDVESKKSRKKLKNSDKQCPSEIESRSSEGDSGFPSSDSSINGKCTGEGEQKCDKMQSKSSKSVNKYEADDIKLLNVSQLLELGENKSHDASGPSVYNNSFETSDSEVEEWEEVTMDEKQDSRIPTIPKDGVNITLEMPVLNHLKRKKRGFDVEAHIKKQMNQVKRELQLLIHKVHLLCWIAHLQFVNGVLNSDCLMGISLSLITNKNLYPPKYADLSYLERIVKWFHTVICLKDYVKDPKCTGGLSQELLYQFEVKSAFSKKHFIFMSIILFRTLGLKTRLVMSFQVVPVKPKAFELNSGGNCNQTDSNKVEVKKKVCNEKDVSHVKINCDKIKKVDEKNVNNDKSTYFSNQNTNVKTGKRNKKGKTVSPDKSSSLEHNKKYQKKNTRISSKLRTSYTGKEVEKHENNNRTLQKDSDSDDHMASEHFKISSKQLIKKKRSTNTENKCNIKDSKSTISENASPKVRTAGASGSLSIKRKKSQHINEEESKKPDKVLKGQTNNKKKAETMVRGVKFNSRTKKAMNTSTSGNKTPSTKNEIMKKADESSDTDSDFIPQSLKKKSRMDAIDRTVLSSDDESKTNKKKEGVDVWVEVFLESEEKWISVDAISQKIHCVNELYSRATQPVVYVIACNPNSTLKDVTKRYVPNWHSDTRKRRVDEAWWNATMWPYRGHITAQDREEDEDINRQILDKPLPSVIAEYKAHPLYALKRHLLKFEGIYPPDAPTLGFVKGEAVYARECVVTLRSREVWFKEARVVRLNEQPYKIVKARPKFDKMTGEVKKDLPLELFGFWQTEEYLPPVATDGKVPRNEYGNVDLFKPCMLPKGTVHLQIPALNKVAKKLGIDCAPAIVGFDFHSGASHPVHDGFVVCEEFKEVLLDAWDKEMDETTKKNEEKRLKRIYDNWKRLIRGLLIREKLKMKYSFGGESDKTSLKASTSRKKNSQKL